MSNKNAYFICYHTVDSINESTNFQKAVNIFLSVYIFLSGFVFIEPGLSEFWFVVFGLYIITKVKIDKQVFWLSTLLSIPCFISSYLGQTFFSLINPKFCLTDIYLFMLFLIAASHLKNSSNSNTLLDEIMLFWTLSGLINIFAGIIAILKGGKLFGLDILIFGLRLKGFFKDPNVLGPFLVPPALFFLNKIFKEKGIILPKLLLFIILSFGVVFTFSRAAWLNYAISISLLILQKSFNRKAINKTIFLVIISILIAIVLWEISSSIELLGVNLRDFFLSRTGLKNYDEDRFAAQRESLDILTSTSILFGTGPGNYEKFSGIATHSLYARYIGERGLFGFLLFLIFFLVIFLNSTKSKFSDLLLPLITGQMINSLFIDSLHWRHLWVLVSLVFLKESKVDKLTCSTKTEEVSM